MKALLLALAALAATGCMRTGLQMIEMSDSSATAMSAGDIRNVAAGLATKDLARVSPKVFVVATGYGALEPNADPAEMGMAMVLGDRAFVRSTRLGGTGVLLKGDEGLVTPALVGLGRQATPTAIYKVRGDVELEDVVREISLRHGPRVYILGLAHFDTLEGTGMTRAPLLGEPVFGEMRGMYFQDGLVEVNKDVYIAGALLSGADELGGSTRPVFWVEPGMETLTDELGALYGAVLTSRDGVRPIDPASAAPHVKSIMQLGPRSVLESGRILVYQLDGFHNR